MALFIGIQYVLTSDLWRAVAPFLPSSSGGESPLPPQLPDPTGNVGVWAATMVTSNQEHTFDSPLHSLNS